MSFRLLMVPSLLALAAGSNPSLAQDPPARVYLTKSDMEQVFIGKAHTFKALNGSKIKWDVKTGGGLYYNNLSFAGTGGGSSGSGTWELKDDGSLCVKWNRSENGNGGCNYYFKKEDGHYGRTGRNAPDARENADVESVG